MRYLIDSHAHMEGFTDVLSEKRRCLEVGVDAVVCVGGDVESSKYAIELGHLHPDFFYPAIGIHPSNILKIDFKNAENFVASNLSNCVALGEVGLDYTYGFARSNDVRNRMRMFLKTLLDIAADAGLPASVHSRSAYRDTLNLVKDSGVEAVFHWYDGPIHVLRELLDAGFFISASPALEWSVGVRTSMHEAPLEQILVETDSPFFLRSLNRQTTPIDVVRVVEALANLKGLETSEVARVTTRNTESLFSI